MEIEDEEAKEQLHFLRVVFAFKCYKSYSMKQIKQTEDSYKKLPDHHKLLLPNFLKNLNTVTECIDKNYVVIKEIISSTENMFENKKDVYSTNYLTKQLGITHFDMDKVKSTLKQFMRDWSSDGQAERDACYKPVIDEIVHIYSDCSDLGKVEILVPGAGMGRLSFELARLGFACQGNEFSLFMLFASNFVLNKCKELNAFTIYPWVHQTSNNMRTCDQVLPVTFPDINPSDFPDNPKFSMVAGDFLEVYTDPDSWDCIATVFFLDTAPNVITYIESICKILKPGGYWINFGPLLYHFADMANENSIELSYDQVKHVIEQFKFEIIKERVNQPSTYNQNAHSMLTYQYNSVFFVARKPL
ncbi:hypothetical protein HELRODRAFT_64289 [Helobdella robusta]|uniref:Carnosine N-methyltransferase n=1 Tax=Helobdella robusta TaxID=6412 RepID=T1FXS3_HELRO|nr:hypothetical protein HELRODRAFT_64289 [Helobdella robusta]ESO06597.1 hypothetical protein HELRODRAFT_64289 [Helobdella robusta]